MAFCAFGVIALIPEDSKGAFGYLILLLGLCVGYYLNIYKERKKEKERLQKEKAVEEAKRLQKEAERIQKEKFENEQLANGLVKYKDKWGTPEQVRGWKEIDVGLNNNFADYTPRQFEEFVAKLFTKMGYSARVTPGSGDYGADVIAEKDGQKTLIECKKYAQGNNVTPEDVQRTLGALWKHKCDKAVFITTSDFTVRARDLEGEGPIELWDKRILHQMVRKYFIVP